MRWDAKLLAGSSTLRIAALCFWVLVLAVDGYGPVNEHLSDGTMVTIEDIPENKSDHLLDEITDLMADIYPNTESSYWRKKTGLGCYIHVCTFPHSLLFCIHNTEHPFRGRLRQLVEPHMRKWSRAGKFS